MSKRPFKKGLIHRVLENGFAPGFECAAFLIDQIAAAVPFSINNVARYAEREEKPWNLETSFPCLMPPFDRIFVEFELSNGKVTTDLGYLFERYREPDQEQSLLSVTAVAAAHSVIGPLGRMVRFPLRADGTVVPPGGEDPRFSERFRFARGEAWLAWTALGSQELDREVFIYGLGMALMAITFLNCKNVTREIAEPIPEALQKKRARSGRKPLVQQYVLNIEPAKEILRREGNSESVGIQQALHICRGHFKDYRKGGGLFGRTKGLFWWDAHARGDIAHGAIDKDYSVSAAEKGGE